MSLTTEWIERQVEELWEKQAATDKQLAVLETHLTRISKSLDSINSHVSKFVWAVMALLLSGLLGLILK